MEEGAEVESATPTARRVRLAGGWVRHIPSPSKGSGDEISVLVVGVVVSAGVPGRLVRAEPGVAFVAVDDDRPASAAHLVRVPLHGHLLVVVALEPQAGVEPANLPLTMRTLYQLSYCGMVTMNWWYLLFRFTLTFPATMLAGMRYMT